MLQYRVRRLTGARKIPGRLYLDKPDTKCGMKATRLLLLTTAFIVTYELASSGSARMSDDLALTAWLCVFVALFFFIFRGAWRAYSGRGFSMYLVMWSCMIAAVIFAVHSTTPSFAPRHQSIGVITWIVEHKQGRSHTFTFGFTTDAGRELTLEAAATPLFFAENRDKVAITYLEEKRPYPRAIRFQALTGLRKGYETAVSADWLGPWLGVLLSALIGVASIIGANRNKRSQKPAAPKQLSD